MNQHAERDGVSLVSSLEFYVRNELNGLVWGRQDLTLTVLGDPAAGTTVGM